MATVLNNLKQVWQQASFTHRALLISILAGFLVVAGLLVHWASQPNMALLYGGLSSKDAASICDKLRDEGTPFEMRDGGTAILVPSDKVYDLRATMMLQGLPEGGDDGWNILDKGELGMSPAKESMQFIRAIAGELSKTIRMMDGVAAARVQVVSDRGNRLTRRRQDAKASVFIKTKGGRAFDMANVMAVTNLVAGAVPGVQPEKVKVIVNGHTKSGMEKDPMAAGTNSLLDYKMKVEKYMGEKVEEMLANVLGPGRSSVRVNVKLSTATMQMTEKKLDPKGVESSTETKNKSVVAASGSRGNSSPGNSTKDKTEKIVFDRSMTQVQKAEGPGKIESKAVAVFVDLSTPGEGEDGKAAPKLTIEDVKKIVGNAIGINSTTGDSITVVNTPFQKVVSEDMPAEEAGFFSPDFLLNLMRRGSLGVLVIGMLLAFKIMKGRAGTAGKKKGKKGGEGEASVEAEGGEGAGGGEQTQKKQAASRAALKGADRALRGQIVNALQANPNEVKQLFLSWVESSNGE